MVSSTARKMRYRADRMTAGCLLVSMVCVLESV